MTLALSIMGIPLIIFGVLSIRIADRVGYSLLLRTAIITDIGCLFISSLTENIWIFALF